MKNKRTHVMITGASGFIGLNLVNFLSKKYYIHAFVRKNQKYIYNNNILKRKINLKKLKKIDPKIEILIHCASKTPPENKQKTCYHNNIKIDEHILKLLKESKVKLFIFLSSISVYGKIKSKFISENTLTNPLDLYGKSKILTERKINSISNKLNINFVILRLCTILGKNSHSTYLSKLGNLMKKEKKLEVYGLNNKYNSCMHISTFLLIIEKLLNVKKFKKKFNLITLHSSSPIKYKVIFNMFKKHFNQKILFYENKIKKGKRYIINSKNRKIYKFNIHKTKDELFKYIKDLKDYKISKFNN